MNLGDQWGSVLANAVVVRQAERERGGIEGIGIRFLGLSGDARAKIEAFLDAAFAEPFDI